MKKNTPKLAHVAPAFGGIAALALSLILGAGSAEAAKSGILSESARQTTVLSPLGTTPTAGRPRQTIEYQPAADDNPIRLRPLASTFASIAPSSWPLPSSATAHPSPGTPDPVVQHTSDRMPAMQMFASRAVAQLANPARTSTIRMLGIRSAHSDSPPHASARAGNILLALARTTSEGVSFAGLEGSRLALSMVLSTHRDHAEHMSSLGVEHVLDRQTTETATPPVLAVVNISLTNSGLSLRRHPDASGLKLADVHPRATQYLQWGEHPAPLAAPTPEVTFTRAGFVQPAPTPVPSTSGNWTAATMPGGNASMYFITGYTATGNRTATGTWPHWGTVAVDRHVIPLGSTVYIQGLGIFHAEDTGGAVLGNHIDVFVNSVSQAYQLTGHRLVSFVPPGGSS